jgi:MFS transporter, PAT family, solute carrier family 33 (acetyl-CoA transportor), member 1
MAVRASSFSVGYQSDDGQVIVPNPVGGGSSVENGSNNNNHDTDKRDEAPEQDDRYNYALLIVLYTLQGIPMGLSASIPFLIQQKVKMITAMAASAAEGSSATGAAAAHAAKLSYQANAIFALCSWPFSLKMLWAPIVDSMYFKRFGRRKSWLVPVQALSGLVMVFGASFVEQQLGLGSLSAVTEKTSRDRILAAATGTLGSQGEEGFMNVRGVTTFFFLLYFLMATQDIAVDGWALSMLSKKNRGRGPVCNSIGQNIGYFLSFVGFLAFNDVEASEAVWRPLLGLRSMPGTGLVSLGGFVQFMGYFMLTTTIVVAFIKTESPVDQSVAYASSIPKSKEALLSSDRFGKANEDDDAELDASQIGLKETYHRLWAVCQLSSVRKLFLILLTYRLPTALSDNVKFLKAVEYGLSKSTTALLSPTVILPLGILVPIVATKVWHGQPLDQFMIGYLVRVMIVPILDLAMLAVVKRGKSHTMMERLTFWLAVVSSTAGQAITSSLQFNAQMTCKSSDEI